MGENVVNDVQRWHCHGMFSIERSIKQRMLSREGKDGLTSFFKISSGIETVMGKERLTKKKKEKQEYMARIKNGPPPCAVSSPTTLPSTTPPREVKHPRMTLRKKVGNQYTLTFQSLSPKQPRINPASPRKTFLQ